MPDEDPFAKVGNKNIEKGEVDPFAHLGQRKSFAQKAAPYVRMGLEYGGMGLGGAAGAASGLLTGGTTSFPGLVAGGALLGASGELMADEYDRLVGLAPPRKRGMEYGKHVAGALGRSALGVMGGEITAGLGKPIVSWLAGKAPVTTIAKLLKIEAPNWATPDQELLGQIAREYGYDLTAVEKLDSPTLQNLWYSVQKSPGIAAEKIRQWFTTRRIPQTEQAMEQFESRLGTKRPSAETGKMAQDAAAEIKSGLKAAQQQAAGPMFEQSYRETPTVDIEPALEKIDKLMSSYKPETEAHQFMQKARSLFTKEGIPEGKSELEIFHNSRKQLDKMISRNLDFEGNPLAENNRRLLLNIRAAVNRQLIEASPAFQQANIEFAERMKPINELLYSDQSKLPRVKKAKSFIGKLLDMDTPNLHKASDELFKQSETEIAKARRWFVDNGHEETWNQIARTKIDEIINNIQQNVTNIEGGKLAYTIEQKIFGKGAIKDQLRSALGSEDFRHLERLMKLFRQSERLVYSNSMTQPLMATQELIDNIVVSPADVGANATKKILTALGMIFEPIKAAKEISIHRRPEKADRIVDLLLDPELRGAVEQVWKYPAGKRTELILKTLGRAAGMEVGRAVSSGW